MCFDRVPYASHCLLSIVCQPKKFFFLKVWQARLTGLDEPRVVRGVEIGRDILYGAVIDVTRLGKKLACGAKEVKCKR